VLDGDAGPVRDIVLLNASAALAADAGVRRPEDLSRVLSEGLARAAEAIDSGAARALLDRWVQASHRLAASGS
jgi:anthranilate phosphoribosyltransferase